jgi:hypothetical protein
VSQGALLQSDLENQMCTTLHISGRRKSKLIEIHLMIYCLKVKKITNIPQPHEIYIPLFYLTKSPKSQAQGIL